MDNIIQEIVKAGGHPHYVGGCVRDNLLGVKSKDQDIEVYGLSPQQLCNLLEKFGSVNYVGNKFAVVKLRRNGEEIDFSLPRKDNKTGVKHTDFDVVVDHNLSPKEAALRRDFTINSISRHCITGELVDPFNGQNDLKNRILRATSDKFDEDPLRVLRGFQFASRFNMQVEPETAKRCNNLLSEYETISSERIWIEWEKWACSKYPSMGLKFLHLTGWICKYPEIEDLLYVKQDKEWHPEGDVFEHTCYVCDAAAEIADRFSLDKRERSILMFAALSHDFGKPSTTQLIDGRWRSFGHCEAGVALAESFLWRIDAPLDYIEIVPKLVAEHLAHVRDEISNRQVKRLAIRLNPANIKQLMYLIEADMNGRPPLTGGLPIQAIEMLKISEELDILDKQPKPIILGRHLIALGHKPGPSFKPILIKCFEAQINGEFASEQEGIAFLKYLLEG